MSILSFCNTFFVCRLLICRDFCLEGTCELCLMEGEGLKETSWKASQTGKDVVRTCLTPFPEGESSIKVKVLTDEEIWNEGVL